MLLHEMLPAYPRPGNRLVEWIIRTVQTLPDRWKLEKHYHPCHESLALWSQVAGEGRGDEMADSGDSPFSGFGCKLVWPRVVVRLLDAGWNAELIKSGWYLRPRIFSGFWEPESALIFRSNRCHSSRAPDAVTVLFCNQCHKFMDSAIFTSLSTILNMSILEQLTGCFLGDHYLLLGEVCMRIFKALFKDNAFISWVGSIH